MEYLSGDSEYGDFLGAVTGEGASSGTGDVRTGTGNGGFGAGGSRVNGAAGWVLA